MSKLLRANFARLRKSRSFWVCMILQIFLAAVKFLYRYAVDPEKAVIFGGQCIAGSYIMIFLSVFITSFICTDYSCKTVRNKLIIGQSRGAVYLSNFITVLTGSIAIAAAYWVTLSAAALSLGGETGMPLNEFCFVILSQTAAVTALVSLYAALSELVTSKSKAVTAALIASLIMVAVFHATKDMYIEFNVQVGLNLQAVFFNDIMPSGQLLQMETGADIPRIFPFYSLAVTAISTIAGVLIFRRKDLK